MGARFTSDTRNDGRFHSFCMSLLPSYPLIFLPESIKTNLATKSQRLIKQSPKGLRPFEATQRIETKLLPLKTAVSYLKYLGYCFSGIVGCLSIADLLRGATLLELLPGLLLLGIKTLLITGLVRWVEILDRAQREDRQQQQKLYWQQNQRNNDSYYENYPDRLQQEFKQANPHLRLNQSTKREPLYNHKFERGTNKKEAQKGVSEKHFMGFLKRYFPDCEIVTDYFALNDKIGYESDFSLITPDGRLGVDIEIDEPYAGRSKEPHHCQDDDKDRNRNNYFLERGWIVLRVSEYQVVRYPESCCQAIAILLDKLGYGSYLPPLKVFDELPSDSSWTSAMAKSMSVRKYRELYLDKAGLFKYDPKREKRNARKSVKKRSKSPAPRYRPKLRKKA